MEWSYDGDKPFNKISEGAEIVFRGVSGTKQDGSPKFSIQKYVSATVKAKPDAIKAKALANSDEPPF